MKESLINQYITFVTTILCLILLSWWILHDPVKHFSEFVPGLDNRPENLIKNVAAVNIGEYFESYQTLPGPLQGNWPRFRGADFDNINKENIKLADHWEKGGPPIVWSVNLGEGHAGPVISNDRVYLLDYDEEKRRELLRCFSFLNGREIWRRGYDIYIKRNHGMSRTVPAASDKYVVTIGPKCQVMCVDADSGTFNWGIDLEKEYDSEVPLWYTGQCPLIDDSAAIVAVGGKSLIMAIHCETGEIIWNTPNHENWKMSHSSIIPMDIYGRKIYVYSALGALVGISSEKKTAGEILFQSTEWDQSVIAPSPVYLGDGKIFVTAGYGAGSMVFKVSLNQGKYTIKNLQKFKPDEGLASEQQTPIFYKDHLFAILPKDAGALRNQFVCCHSDDWGKMVWTSGKTNRFGLGPYIFADNKFYILSDDGILTVIEGSTDEYVQLGQVKILNGVDAWGPMALSNGRLIARDSRQMVCIDIRARL